MNSYITYILSMSRFIVLAPMRSVASLMKQAEHLNLDISLEDESGTFCKEGFSILARIVISTWLNSKIKNCKKW